MGKIKAVLDTNILVSLLFKKGLAKEFSKLMEKGSVEFYSSEEILGELARVLTYPKIEEVFKKAE
jgi:putative PIN family toxin of toxin-antitoxin system